jgi:hypothetical protein
MQEQNLYIELLQYMLPVELVSNFELKSISRNAETLYLYLDENNIIPVEYLSLDLYANSFFEESIIKDFPLRDKKVVLHIRRRR